VIATALGGGPRRAGDASTGNHDRVTGGILFLGRVADPTRS
jgi:hypothetical protein